MSTKTITLSKRVSEKPEPEPHLNNIDAHTSKRRRVDAAADATSTIKTSRVQDIDPTRPILDPNGLSDVLSRGNHVKTMLEKELPQFKSHMTPSLEFPLEFELVRSATELTTEDLNVCFNLIHTTSGADYKASSIGWNPEQKKDEMSDEEMMYLLIRQGNVVERVDGKDFSKHVTSTDDVSAAQPDTFPQLKLHSAPGSEEKPCANTKSTTSRPHLTNANPILGFISFMFTSDDPPHQDRQVVYIYEVHLHENLRGRGLGSDLVRFVEKVARRFDITKTMLTVFTSNEKAKRVYERLGYTKDSCSPKDRVMRRKTVKAEYVIMSKEIL